MKKYRCNITYNYNNTTTVKVGTIIDEFQYKSLSMQEKRNFKILT